MKIINRIYSNKSAVLLAMENKEIRGEKQHLYQVALLSFVDILQKGRAMNI